MKCVLTLLSLLALLPALPAVPVNQSKLAKNPGIESEKEPDFDKDDNTAVGAQDFKPAMVPGGPEEETIDAKISAAYKSDTTDEGDIIIGGDMIIKREEFQNAGKTGYAGLSSWARFWTNGIIPYVIETSDFSPEDLATIRAAMDDWENSTCLSFRPRLASDVNYIHIRQAEGCNSYVGMVGGGQRISLDSGCRGKGTIMHELGHAIGFKHEHQRPDRDDHITVLEDNIKERWVSSLSKLDWNRFLLYGIPYDYGSIMHYTQWAFGKTVDGTRLRTIVTKQSEWQRKIGTGELPAFYDFKMVNLVYGCGAHCPLKECRDDGFLDKSCSCRCKGKPIHDCDDGDEDGDGFYFPCDDLNGSCGYWAGLGYCQEESVYFGYMWGNCKTSCGFC